MSSVTPLPGASDSPIQNPPRRGGRYPDGVESLTVFRSVRRARAQEAAKASARSPKPLASITEANGWPFPDIERERFYRLTWEQQVEVQGAVRAALALLERW